MSNSLNKIWLKNLKSSNLVDRLSRRKTTSQSDRALLASFEKKEVPKPFRDWMVSPTEDWDLFMKILPTVNPYFAQ